MGDRSNASGNVICMGSIIMDISIRCPQFPEVGETMYTPYSYEALPGGKGANQAVAATVWVAMLKCLGEYPQMTMAEHWKPVLNRKG